MSDERDQPDDAEAPPSSEEPAGAPEADAPEADAPEADAPESKETATKPAPKVGPDASAPPPATTKPSYGFLAIASLLALAADLGSKAWAVSRLDGPHADRIVVVENFFHLDLAHNKGGAWGIFGEQPDYVRLPFFFLISAIAVVFVVSLYKRLEPRQVALKWALPLLLGGAAGNLIDRIRHQYVVDFLDVFIVRDGRQTHWPTFNVADVWIVIGVGLMAIDMFTPRKPVPDKGDDGGDAKKRQKEAEAEA